MLNWIKKLYRRAYKMPTPEHWKVAGDLILVFLQSSAVVEFSKENHLAGIVLAAVGVLANFASRLPIKNKVSEEKTCL